MTEITEKGDYFLFAVAAMNTMSAQQPLAGRALSVWFNITFNLAK